MTATHRPTARRFGPGWLAPPHEWIAPLAPSAGRVDWHGHPALIDLYRQAGARAGHGPERLKVGLHCLGYVADTNQQAADEFFPGYAEAFTKIGRERGWPPTTRAHFDALLGPTGALHVGDAEAVVEKILRQNEVLGGIDRFSFQMSVAALPHRPLMHAIELLGTQVIPLLRRELG